MRISGRHWALALFAALLIHAGVAAAVLWRAPTAGARGWGSGGIEISLGSVGGAPQPASDAVSTAAANPAATAEPVEQEPSLPERAISEPVPPEPIAPEPVIPEPPKSEPAVTEPVAPEPVPPEPEAIAPEPEPPVAEPPIETVPIETIEEAEVIPPPEAEPEPESEVPEEQVAMRAVAPPPAPRAKPTPPPRTVRPSPAAAVPAASTATAAPDQVASAPPRPSGVAGDGGNPEASGAVTRTGGGVKGDYVDYMTRLQAWLEEHKEYPRRARRQGREGTTLLYFVMDREGRVLDYRIRESSGDELLDQAAMEMIERAQPLPRMPETMRQAQLEIVVPVAFTLR